MNNLVLNITATRLTLMTQCWISTDSVIWGQDFSDVFDCWADLSSCTQLNFQQRAVITHQPQHFHIKSNTSTLTDVHFWLNQNIPLHFHGGGGAKVWLYLHTSFDMFDFCCLCPVNQNDDIETDLNKLHPKSQSHPFEELRVYERFFLELSEDFQVSVLCIWWENLAPSSPKHRCKPRVFDS